MLIFVLPNPLFLTCLLNSEGTLPATTKQPPPPLAQQFKYGGEDVHAYARVVPPPVGQAAVPWRIAFVAADSNLAPPNPIR